MKKKDFDVGENNFCELGRKNRAERGGVGACRWILCENQADR